MRNHSFQPSSWRIDKPLRLLLLRARRWNLKLASRFLNRKTKKLNGENWMTDMNRRDHRVPHTCKISTFVSKPNSQPRPRNSKNQRAKPETSGHRPPLVSVSLSTFQVVFPETDCQTDCRQRLCNNLPSLTH